jgi:hypothetical protein
VYTEFNAREENWIRVPLGVSTFPYDAFPVPRKGVEATATDLRFFRGEWKVCGCVDCVPPDGVLTPGCQRRDLCLGVDLVADDCAEYDHGGHFACMECPEDVVKDLREFFPQVYPSS